MIIRCVDLVRGTQIKFLPTRCRTFGLVVELGAQMGAKRGPGALLSIDFRPPWGGSAASLSIMSDFHIFRHPIAPFSLYYTARETDGGTIDRVIDPFAPFEGLVLRHIENDRSSCSIGVLAAFIGLRRWSCQEPIFGPFWAPNNSARKQKR